MMMRLLAAACLVAVALSLPERNLSDVEYEGMWQGYVADFKKVYHPAEVMTRFEIFKDNVDFINHHNKNLADKLGYTVGLNARAMPKKDLNVELFDTSNLADSVDWTTKNAVTPVKNQGQCGSCWAFSTTGSTEGAYAIKTGTLKSFSEQELVDCAQSFGNQGCNGGLMDNGFRYIEAKGDTLESTYAYTAKTGTCQTSKQAQEAVTIASYKDVPPRTKTSSRPPWPSSLSPSPSRPTSPASSSTRTVSSPAPAATGSTTVSSSSATVPSAARTTGRSRTRGAAPGARRVTFSSSAAPAPATPASAASPASPRTLPSARPRRRPRPRRRRRPLRRLARPTTATPPTAVSPTSKPSVSRASRAPSVPPTASPPPARPTSPLVSPRTLSALSSRPPATRSAPSSAPLRPTRLRSAPVMPSAARPPASRSRALASAPTALARPLLARPLLARRLLLLRASVTSRPASSVVRASSSVSVSASRASPLASLASARTSAPAVRASRRSSRSFSARRPPPRSQSSCSFSKCNISM